MRVRILNHSDTCGGAARAAYRIHQCIREVGIDSKMWVNVASAADSTIYGPSGKFEQVMAYLRAEVGGQFRRSIMASECHTYSPAVFPSRWVKRINGADVDLVHLHWVQSEMMSVSDIGSIKKPIVWTLHDMWAFCGAEHYTNSDRWKKGYRSDNRPSGETGFDLNLWTWKRKYKHWSREMYIVAPSQWLADCARDSALLRDCSIRVIPNAINTEFWKPVPKRLARDLLGLPNEVPLILFGAIGGIHDPRKGFDLLLEAMQLLRAQPSLKNLEIVVFGQLAPQEPLNLGFPIHFVGHLHDDLSMRALYSASDAILLPSRMDNLPNTGVEAQACGTPVVAFGVGGLPDIVKHKHTGYLAKAFEIEDFATGVIWVLEHSRALLLGKQARARAEKLFSYPVVAKQYSEQYATALDNF